MHGAYTVIFDNGGKRIAAIHGHGHKLNLSPGYTAKLVVYKKHQMTGFGQDDENETPTTPYEKAEYYAARNKSELFGLAQEQLFGPDEQSGPDEFANGKDPNSLF